MFSINKMLQRTYGFTYFKNIHNICQTNSHHFCIWNQCGSKISFINWKLIACIHNGLKFNIYVILSLCFTQILECSLKEHYSIFSLWTTYILNNNNNILKLFCQRNKHFYTRRFKDGFVCRDKSTLNPLNEFHFKNTLKYIKQI